jgi:drug/metabolite transporter (DMT)-like permease
VSLVALGLVLFSALCHATWNLFAKRTNGGATFVWLYDLLSVIIYAPIMVVLFITLHLTFTPTALIFIVGSAFFHLCYFILLQRGYRVGDMSLVYPLGRGTGPLLTTIIALTFFGEHLPWYAILGVLLIVVGIFIITGGIRLFKATESHMAVFYGLIIGFFIACYTLWDKQGVSTYHIFPIMLYYYTIVVRLILLSPYGLLRWKEVYQNWQTYRMEAIGVAVLSPLSYLLILITLVFTQVSYIAPAREIGVLFGTLMGTHFLSEGDGKRRLLAAAMIVLGVVALAV